MSIHHINAAHNGIHWTIGIGPDDEPVEGDFFMQNDLYTLFECSCGAEFERKSDAIDHLLSVCSNSNGEAVQRFPEV